MFVSYLQFYFTLYQICINCSYAGQKVISPREGDNYGNINVLSDDEDGGVGGGGDISDSDGDREAPPTVAPHSGGGVVGDENIRTQYDKLAPADKAAMQKALMGKLGGKSAFALQELKKATEQQGHGGNSSSRPGLLSKRPFGSNTSATSRYAADTSKVLPLENTVSSTSPTTAAAAAVASVGDTDDAAGVPGAPTHAASPSAPTLSKVIKRHAAEAPAAGMFALTRNAKSNKSLVHHNHNPFAPKQHQSSHHHNHHHHNNGTGSGAHGVNGSAELKALTVNVQTLTRTVEVQNDMILALYVQILALKQQQQSSDGGDSNHRSGTQQKGTEITFPVLTPSPHIAGTIARLNEAANRHSPGKLSPTLISDAR